MEKGGKNMSAEIKDLPDPDESVFKALGGKRTISLPSWVNLEEHSWLSRFINQERSDGAIWLTFRDVKDWKGYCVLRNQIRPETNPILDEILASY